MTPEKAVAHILDAENPLEVVHSLPEEDFYFLIRDAGPEDALPILSLASDKQLEYLLDIDIWSRDRLNMYSATQWIGWLMKADPQRTAQWFSNQKIDFLEFFVFKNIEVIIREPDQDPSDFGKDFITFDDIFYFRLVDIKAGMEATDYTSGEQHADGYIKNREKLLKAFMKRLSDRDNSLFQNILAESMALIPSETEEELYRLRNVRLAEKGFLPFEEAIGIYQPLKPRDIGHSQQKSLIKTDDIEPLMPVPYFTSQMIDAKSPFAKALASIHDERTVVQLQSEFASLSNQLIVADRKVIVERPLLKEVVKKACGFVSIGLDHLYGDHADLIRKYPLADIFRVGYGLALDLKWRTEKWRGKSWFAAENLPLNFWGEEWLGVIGGLLLKRPLYFDNYETGVLYRNFASVNDITKTEMALNEIITFDNLLAQLPLKGKPLRGHSLLTHKSLILTLWARAYLGLDPEHPELSALQLDDFKTFFNDLWNPGKKPRTIKVSMKTDFLKWLSTASGLSSAEITDQSGTTLENLFIEIENEYGAVDTHSPDPRFIPHFLIENGNT
jgi:hypothetical protein